MSAAQILMDAGLEYSHWGRRIRLAEGRGGFNGLDQLDAAQWPTCACGELDESLIGPGGAPIDDKLVRLGARVLVAVNDDKFEMATVYLIEIMTRSGELLR